MSAPFKKRLHYRFEQFIARGGTSIFLSLLITFLICFGLIVLTRAIVLMAIGPVEDYNTVKSFWDHTWYVFLQMTDPGNMYQDSMTTGWIRVTTVLAGFFGVILLSMLIAFITSSIEGVLYKFRKGRGPVLESGHTVILGWTERVVDIIRELVIANESEPKACIVILAEESKEVMDDFISKRITHSKTTKIITSNGNPSNLSELKRISAQHAKSAIILATCSDSATHEEKLTSDTQVVKSVMAMISCQGGENHIPIVSEIFTAEKREIISFFEDEKIIAIDSWDIMGKLLVQTSLTSGLEMVYNEILSFDLSEIYFHSNPAWKGLPFEELVYHFRDGIPMGIHRSDGSLIMRPEKGTLMEAEDEILILAEDDSSIRFSPAVIFTPSEIPYTHKQREKTVKKVLILGWHHVGRLFVTESIEYLKEGSVIDIIIPNPASEILEQIQGLSNEYPGFGINVSIQNTISINTLREIGPYTYDNIIILSQNPEEHNPDKVDSDTLMILLLLRKIASENGLQNSNKTKIITQVLNSDNQDLIIQTDVDDFIISNKLITMILAQLSENPVIKKLYDDIFTEDGSEIYVKPVTLYFDQFPVKQNFATILNQASKRNEICLGVRYGELSKNPKKNFGVVLNPDKGREITLNEGDFLVVLSEEEL